VKFRDTGYNPNITWHGAIGFSLDASTNWGNLIFDSIHSKNLVGSVIVSGGNSTTRIRGIKIGQLFSDDCYYGFNAQENGDGVVIDNLVAYQNYRPFYVYGVTDHKVKIFSRKNRATSAAVNISRSVLNTSGIDITYVARDQDQAITHVLINHVGLGGGEISNVRVNVDIQSSAVYAPVRFVNYTGSGGTETNAASLNRVYDITLEGSCDGQALQVTSVASYVDKGQLTFKHGQNFYPDATIFPLFRLGRVLRGYGVPWTSTGTAPVLGNGSCLVDTDLVDGIAVNTVKFLPGSTTTFGTGTWLFGLPYKASCAAVGSVWILDSGNAFFIGVAKIEAGDLTAQIFTNNAGTSASATSPFTWQNGDQMYFSIAYPVS
jgi:hypothetical protein